MFDKNDMIYALQICCTQHYQGSLSFPALFSACFPRQDLNRENHSIIPASK